jgi:hypothetical protein
VAAPDDVRLDGDDAPCDEADGRRSCSQLGHRGSRDLGDRSHGGRVAQQADQSLSQRSDRRDQGRRKHRAKPPAQLSPGAEEERFDGRLGDVQGLGELLVRHPRKLPHDKRVPLLRREILDRRPQGSEVGLADCGVERIRAVARPFRVRLRERLTHSVARPRPALVAGDGGEPGGRLTGLGSAEKAAVGREERLLSRILSLGRVAQEHAAEAEDHPAVALEELGRLLSRLFDRQRARFEDGFDAASHLGNLVRRSSKRPCGKKRPELPPGSAPGPLSSPQS